MIEIFIEPDIINYGYSIRLFYGFEFVAAMFLKKHETSLAHGKISRDDISKLIKTLNELLEKEDEQCQSQAITEIQEKNETSKTNE